MKNDMPSIYQMVNDRMIAALEKGCIPWKQPWTSDTVPRNLITSRPYRGINTWLLQSLNYSSNYFLSLKQVNALGGRVKKGEISCPVVYWKRNEEPDKNPNERKTSWVLRYYRVFNVKQCEDIPEHFIPVIVPSDNKPINTCKNIVKHMPNPPKITTSKVENEAYYSPEADTIYTPSLSRFKSSPDYYTTLFHELIHSTGHEKRLNRSGITIPTDRSSKVYSMEELIAEMGACYLASVAGLTDMDFDNSASYVQGWLKRLKSDRSFIFKASSQAQQATDYILNASDIYKDQEPKKELAGA